MYFVDVAVFIAGILFELVGASTKEKGLFKWVWSKGLLNDNELLHLLIRLIGKIILIIAGILLLYMIITYEPASDRTLFDDQLL